MNNREKVLNYLNSEDITPLHFHFTDDFNDKLEFEKVSGNINELVKLVLKFTRGTSSYNVDDEFACGIERWRSCIDIWRHIIYYFPNITIFEVMKSLYDIRDECGGQYCGTVRRRTFKIKIYSGDRGWFNQTFDGLYTDFRDEFGLLWEDWETI